MTPQEISKLTMDELKALADKEICDKYLPVQGEGDTMATQFVTAVCKLVYKYYNDGDRYDQESINDMSTYANWIDNHCFRLLKGNEDYEEKLRYILERMILTFDLYLDKKAVGSIYKEEGYFQSDDKGLYYYEDDEDY